MGKPRQHGFYGADHKLIHELMAQLVEACGYDRDWITTFGSYSIYPSIPSPTGAVKVSIDIGSFHLLVPPIEEADHGMGNL